MPYYVVHILCIAFSTMLAGANNINVFPFIISIEINSSISFKCIQSNSSYINDTAWFFNGTQLINRPQSRIFSNSSLLKINSARKLDSGIYECRNRFNQSAPCTLIVYKMPNYFNQFIWVAVPIFISFALFLLARLLCFCTEMCCRKNQVSRYSKLTTATAA